MRDRNDTRTLMHWKYNGLNTIWVKLHQLEQFLIVSYCPCSQLTHNREECCRFGTIVVVISQCTKVKYNYKYFVVQTAAC